MDQNTIPHLITQHIRGELTEDEQTALNEWLTKQEHRHFFEDVTDPGYQEQALVKMHAYVVDLGKGRELVNEKIKRNESIQRLRTVATIAASILIVLSFAIYFWPADKKGPGETATTNNKQHQMQPDVDPGSQKATLTLADGSRIVLDSAGHGPIAQQGGTSITNNTNGQLVYNVTNKANAAGSMLYNTLKTEKGQTYSVVLPDGSRVWLNAASTINYPVAFNKERRVKITGEAYFEIKTLLRDLTEKFPFIVMVADSGGNTLKEVEVLGTQFNINAYKEENTITTTLLEGKVKIKKGENIILSEPNQQGVLSKATGDIDIVRNVNIEKIVSWKNNYFYFDRDSLATVIKQIAQWYDVDFVIDKRLSDKIFSGRIMRNMPLSKVLEKLGMTSRRQFAVYEGKKRITISLKP